MSIVLFWIYTFSALVNAMLFMWYVNTDDKKLTATDKFAIAVASLVPIYNTWFIIRIALTAFRTRNQP